MAQTDWIYTLPWLCAFLWTAGGRPEGRWLRRLCVGVAVFTFSYEYTRNVITFFCVPTYFVATSVGYGKYIQQRNWLMTATIGALYGMASLPVCMVAGFGLYGYQIALAAIGWTASVWLSNKKGRRLHWAIAEAMTGLTATFLIPFMLLP